MLREEVSVRQPTVFILVVVVLETAVVGTLQVENLNVYSVCALLVVPLISPGTACR